MEKTDRLVWSFWADRHRLTSAYSVETNILLTDA